MAKWAQGKFTVKNTDKYAGLGSPRYRSSWEFAFMRFCDENPSVIKWASESIKIPYRNPFTGKYTVYVPDFFIVYVDKDNQKHAEVIEVKPLSQTSLAEAKRNKLHRAHAVLNEAKWGAARAWCSQNGVTFRVVSENDIFHNGRTR